jgi:predicted branched-subunit amino acid permease
MAPVIAGLVPAGVAVGAAWAASGLPAGAGLLASATVYGASAQLVLVDLGTRPTALGVVALTMAVASLRLTLLGAGLGRHLRDSSIGFRWLAAVLLVDPAYLVADARFAEPSTPTLRRRFYLGAAGSLWVSWQVAHAVGLLLGSAIPSALALDFALPLCLLALLTARLGERATRVAAVVAAAFAVVARPAPLGAGLLIAVAAGVVAAQRLGVTTR